MSYFGKSNFAYGTVLTPPSPAASGISLTLNSGQGALFGSTLPYPAIVWPAGPYAGTLATAEIVLVTGRVGDVFTVTRTQEGTAARTILAGDQFAQVPTAAVWQEIQDAIDNIPGGGDVVGPVSAVDGRPALFDGVTGKLLKQAAAVLGSAAFVPTSTFDAAGSAAAAQAASQPLDSDLTAIAAIAPSDSDLIARVSGAWVKVTPSTVGFTVESGILKAIVLVQAAASDTTGENTAGAGKVSFRVNFGGGSGTLISVRACVKTAPTGSDEIYDINKNGTTVLSTKVTIEAGETSSLGATPPVISVPAWADDDVFSVDVDQAGSTTGSIELVVSAIFKVTPP